MRPQLETEREKAYRKIRKAIMFGELKPGEKVVERRLCKMLDLGRTPAREAIRKLESEGFIRAVPNRGAYVTKTSIRDMEEIAEVVAALEVYSIGMAAEMIAPDQVIQLEQIEEEVSAAAKSGNYESYAEKDFQFHGFFPTLSGNAFLLCEIRRLRNRLFLVRALNKALFDHVDEYILDHQAIVEAVIQKKPGKARRAMQIHVMHAKDHFVAFLRENPWLL